MNTTNILTSQSLKRTAAVLSLITGSVVAASAAATDPGIAALRAELAELSAKIAELETTQQEAQSSSPKITAGRNGLRITSPDGAYDFRVNGLIQLDGRFYSGDAANDTFDLRRVRPTLQGTLGQNFDFRFTAELAGNVRILDAFGNYRFAENTSLRFGNFKGPVGLERLQGAANLFFNERGFPTEFTPARELGFQLETVVAEFVELKAGVFNGAPDGSNGAPTLNGSGDFTGAGSVYVQPFKQGDTEALRGLRFGIAGSYGKRDANAGFRVRAPNRLNVAINNNILEDGNAYRINPGLFYTYGPFALLGEYNLSSRELFLAGGSPKRYDNSGWTVAGSYFLTGENNSYGNVVPKNPFRGFGSGGSGAWELALRYTGVRLDSDPFDDGLLNNAQARRANTYDTGINWIATTNFRVLLSYDYTTYTAGNAGGGNRAPTHAILTRFQVAF